MKKEIYEIERKFLVKSIPQDIEKYECFDIEQGYISTDPTIRIRRRNNEYILTVKGSGTVKKLEYEIDIDKRQYEKLRSKTEGIFIRKKRYIIPLQKGLKAELDIYFGDLEGFMNVEVEFEDMPNAVMFEAPDWFGKEVTQDRRYSNGSLSLYGVPDEVKDEK